MARTVPRKETTDVSGEEAVARLRELRAEFVEATKDLTEAEREALIDRWAADVEAGLAEHVRRNRKESDRARA